MALGLGSGGAFSGVPIGSFLCGQTGRQTDELILQQCLAYRPLRACVAVSEG